MRKTPPLHRSIQEYILSKLPEGEAIIEYSLPNHYADVAWIEKKILFEIQCSPLPIEKAVKRVKDYHEMGFSLVWILHEKSFNRKSLNRSELYLRGQVAYYTNLSVTSHGVIYDQYEHYRDGKRILRSKPLPVDIAKPIYKKNKLHFEGDRALSPKLIRKEFEKEIKASEPPLGKKLFQFYDRGFSKIVRQFVY